MNLPALCIGNTWCPYALIRVFKHPRFQFLFFKEKRKEKGNCLYILDTRLGNLKSREVDILDQSSLLRPKPASINNPIPQLYVGFLEVIVHNNLVVGIGLLGEFNFVYGLCETFASFQLAAITRAHIFNIYD